MKGSKARRYHIERPVSEGREAPLLDKFAGEIVSWILRDAPWSGAVVIGVLGGRGSGKTSLLQVLGSRMLRDGKHFDLPVTVDERPKLIEPDRLDDAEDDLLFQIFDHLDPWPADRRSGPPRRAEDDPLHDPRRIATRRADSGSFTDMARDSATSAAQLPERLIAVKAGLAASFRHSSAEVLAYLRDNRSIGESKGRRLVLLVDDLDLQPHRTLELLELVPRVLDHPGVVLVISGDEPLLVEALQRSLKDKRRDGPGLGRALFDKRVPYVWRLEPWDPWHRFRYLWDGPKAEGRGVEQVDPVLPGFWSDDALEALTEAHRRFHPGVADDERPKTVRDHAKALLAELLPGTPRGLKALHNRLLQEQEQKGDRLLMVKIRLLDETFSLPPVLLHPARTLFAAADVALPQLGIERALTAFPEDLVRGLRAFRDDVEQRPPAMDPKERVAQQEQREQRLRAESLARRAEQDALLRLLGVDVGKGNTMEVEARNLLMKLARALAQLETLATREDDLRFVGVSLDQDAVTVFQPVWRFKIQDQKVSDLRLRPDGQLGRTSVAELTTWLRAPALLDRVQALAQSRDRTWVGAKAPLSSLVWLGWMLRYMKVEVVFNDYSGTVTRFDLPDQRLSYDRRGATDGLTLVEPAPADGLGEDAVLLIDLLGKATEAQLGAFEGAPPDARRILVRRQGAAPVAPADLGPLLQDTVEILGRLRDEGVNTFHLGLLALDVYAFALGRQLHAQGEVLVYEWERPSGPYRPVCALIESGEQAVVSDLPDTVQRRDTGD